MSNRSRRFALLDFTAKELEVVALRTSGVKPEAIARVMNAKVDTTRWRLRQAMKKAGIDDIVMLTRWAIENALDLPLEPERPEDIPRMESWRDRSPRVKIKLGRIRRSRLMENRRVSPGE